MQDDPNRKEIQQEADGSVSFRWSKVADQSSAVPKGLLHRPPKWVAPLLDRKATYTEVVQALGDETRRSKGRAEYRSLLRVVEQLAQTDEGRQTIDRVLTAGFIPWLTTIASSPLSYIPAIILYENADGSGHSAWLNCWEDEAVWPVANLQAAHLDQTISAVWQDNNWPFVELFLFDGPDLQGRLVRIARVKSPDTQLVMELDFPGLDDQARSVLGSARSSPGRRFSAEQELQAAVELTFSQWASEPGVTQFGTASLAEPPRFSWDGYYHWLKPWAIYPPPPKTAALRIHLVIRIDDVIYGRTTVSYLSDNVLKRNGGANPVEWGYQATIVNIPWPWRGEIPPPGPEDVRWGIYIGDILSVRLGNLLEEHIGILAGPSPGSLRIFPGRSTLVPTPPSTGYGLGELGDTDDDATIVLSP
jgi:hypothetical protein